MHFVRNITNNNVRVGVSDKKTGELDGVQLEPSVVVTEINPKTRERSVRPGTDVAQVSDETFNNVKFSRSVGVLLETISEEQYSARMEVLNSYHKNRGAATQTVPSHLGSDQVLNVVIDKQEQAVATYAMDSQTFEIKEDKTYAGAERVTEGRADPARGGASLTELREGVRRSTDAAPMPVDPNVLNSLGQGN